MFDGCKLILSSFIGRDKQKAWNKTREEYMPEKRGQVETDGDHITIKRMVRIIFRR